MAYKRFYKNKRILITGHTGFKGSWLCKVLEQLGAIVIGYSLEPPTNPNLFEISTVNNKVKTVFGDIRDFEKLKRVFEEEQPEIVIHLAAQPLVRTSYAQPRYTYETNVMGTVNICECVRLSKTVKSFLNVTTDKVYKNNEWQWGYRENEPLDGFDPYSNSKSCSDIITHSYSNAFFSSQHIGVSTARAGNVIGGGDFAENRIIPDCIRAMKDKKEIIVRNPYSVRPYQHVLEPLFAYLLIAQKQFESYYNGGVYNVGPNEGDCVTTEKLVDLFCEMWGEKATWVNKELGGPHEANLLKLDCSKIKHNLGWRPLWNIEKTIEKTVEWSKIYFEQGDVDKCMNLQIEEYLNQLKRNEE